MPIVKGEKKLNEFPDLVQNAKDMLDQFTWWLNALTTAARRRRERQEGGLRARQFSLPLAGRG